MKVDINALLARGFSPWAIADELVQDLRDRIKTRTIRDPEIRKVIEKVNALRGGKDAAK